LLIFCTGAFSIFAAGCLPYIVGAVATSKSCVDPEFSKTHDLNFRQLSTKTEAVLLFDTKGRFIGFPESPFKNTFLDAVKNCGAFSDVVAVSNDRDLQKYAGRDVIRIQLEHLGLKLKGSSSYRENYQATVRFEFKTTGHTGAYVYPSSLWHVEYGANISTDEAHPMIDSQDQTIRQFAQEIVLAACSEAQRSGRYLQ